MESLHIRQRLRPTRYFFLIKNDDVKAALRVVSINTTLWGGVYNPIGLIEREEECVGLIKEFDPDVIVNLSGKEVSLTMAARYEGRIVSSNGLVQEGPDGSRLAIGFGMAPILREIQQKVMNLTSPPRIVIPSIKSAESRAWAA